MSNFLSGKTANEIRDGAFAVLLSEGLPYLSYEKVAQASGVTRQLVRYHFPEPETLMLEICEQLATNYREIMIRSVSQDPTQNRLSVFFDFYFDLLEGAVKPRDDQVYDALFSLAAKSEPIRTNLREQYQLLGKVLSHELRLEHSSISIESCEEIAYLLITIMYGHWKMVATLGMAESNNRVARSAIDRLLASYLKEPTPQSVSSVFKDP
ncbi:MAG: TetR/AcrR family transcriptional regulator [Sulfitobacter sp.]